MPTGTVRRMGAIALSLALLTSTLYADWTQFALPDLSGAWGPTALGHLPDGRYLFSENGNFIRQDTWSNAAYSAYSGEPVTDPSFIAVWDDNTAAAGQGTFGASDVDTFDPSNLSAPAFTNVGVSLQNYHGVFRDSNSLYTGGTDTGAGGDQHGLRYMTLDGSVNTVVIDDISLWSTGFDIDSSGNLYVGDNDDGSVYMFTEAQLDSAISGSPLAITDGTFVHDFGEGGDIGSLAVDGLGRLWASGWMHNGIDVYNPATSSSYTYIPALDNANYKVTSFERDGEYYVAYMNQADPGQAGSAQSYGFDLVSMYAVPEPGVMGLVSIGLIVLAACRRRTA